MFSSSAAVFRFPPEGPPVAAGIRPRTIDSRQGTLCRLPGAPCQTPCRRSLPDLDRHRGGEIRRRARPGRLNGGASQAPLGAREWPRRGRPCCRNAQPGKTGASAIASTSTFKPKCSGAGRHDGACRPGAAGPLGVDGVEARASCRRCRHRRAPAPGGRCRCRRPSSAARTLASTCLACASNGASLRRAAIRRDRQLPGDEDEAVGHRGMAVVAAGRHQPLGLQRDRISASPAMEAPPGRQPAVSGQRVVVAETARRWRRHGWAGCAGACRSESARRRRGRARRCATAMPCSWLAPLTM